MANNKRLPGILMEPEEIIKILTYHLETHYPDHHYLQVVNPSEKEIDIQIIIGTILAPAILTLQKREDGTVSIAVRKNYGKDQQFKLAEKLRTELYLACGVGAPLEINDRYENIEVSEYEAIISYLDIMPNIIRVHPPMGQTAFMTQYLDSSQRKLTIHYYPTTRLMMAQTGEQSLSNLFSEAIKSTTKIITKDMQFASHEALVLDLSEEDALNQTITNALGNEIVQYISEKNPDLLRTLHSAFNLKRLRKTMSTKDYSEMVYSICRSYEGLLMTLFDQLRLPKTWTDKNGSRKEMFLANYFFHNKHTDTYSFHKRYIVSMPNSERDSLGKFFKPYSLYRNPADHGGYPGRHQSIMKYKDAENIFNKIVNSMCESYIILIKYCP